MLVRGLLFTAQSEDYGSVAVLDEIILDVFDKSGLSQNKDYWLMAGSAALDSLEPPPPAMPSYMGSSQEQGSSQRPQTPPLSEGPLPLLEYLAGQLKNDSRSAAEGGILFLVVAGELPDDLYERFKTIEAPDKRLYLNIPKEEWPAQNGSPVKMATYSAIPTELRLTRLLSCVSDL